MREMPSGREMEVDAGEWFYDALDVMPPSPTASAGDVSAFLRRQASLPSLLCDAREWFYDDLDAMPPSPTTPAEDFERDTRLSVYLHRQVSLSSPPLGLRVVGYVRRGSAYESRQHQDKPSSRLQELLTPHSRSSSRILQEDRRSTVDSCNDIVADTCAVSGRRSILCLQDTVLEG